jgi:hypothetical protein
MLKVMKSYENMKKNFLVLISFELNEIVLRVKNCKNVEKGTEKYIFSLTPQKIGYFTCFHNYVESGKSEC